jgi:hypothetical protein
MIMRVNFTLPRGHPHHCLRLDKKGFFSFLGLSSIPRREGTNCRPKVIKCYVHSSHTDITYNRYNGRATSNIKLTREVEGKKPFPNSPSFFTRVELIDSLNISHT